MSECKNAWVWFEPVVHFTDGSSMYRSNRGTSNISKSLAYSFLWKTQWLTAMFYHMLFVHVLESLTCAERTKSLSGTVVTLYTPKKYFKKTTF